MTNPIKDIEHAHMGITIEENGGTLRISKKELSAESIQRIEAMCAEKGIQCTNGFNNNLRINGSLNEVYDMRAAISKRMMPSQMVQAVQTVTKKGVQATKQALQTTANIARTIDTNTGTVMLAAAGKGTQAITKAGKGGWPLMAFIAAADPEGTSEFIDDILHLRAFKIATDMYEGGKQLASHHPLDTMAEIGSAIENKAANYYEGTDGVWDTCFRTSMIPLHGALNIGCVLVAAAGSVMDLPKAGTNWIMDACGSNTEFVREGTSIKDFKKDPSKFFSNVFTPARRDKTTGLRTDDDFNSIIFRGDTKAFEAYLKTGVDVNTYIAGNHDGGYHLYPTAFALAVSESQFDMANMLLDNKKTYINQQNEVSKDTPLMNAIAYTALDESSPEYFTGKPDMSNASEEETVKFAKANALILKMINDERINLEATNTADETAFLTAAACGNIAAMFALAEKGANMHHTNRWGQNALHLACCNRLMTSELLSFGIDANAKDKDGNTPLMTALEKNEEKDGKNNIAVCLLIGHMNEDGLKALRISEKHSQLLDDWFENYPQVKEAILAMENHPLKNDAKFIGTHGQNSLREQLAQVSEKQPTTTETILPETGITR